MLRQAARRLAPALGGAGARYMSSASSATGGATTNRSAAPILIVLGAGAGLWYAKENGMLGDFVGVPGPSSTTPDYDAVRAAIAARLDADDYDDGSYGPFLVRLAWHCSGTYDKASGTGGSNGATMRFDPEAGHGANAGLGIARGLLEPVKKMFPWISYADLYTLAGVVAIEEMGGPTIAWSPGRSDAASGDACTPDGRLPDATQGASHLRNIFYRMGFDDRAIVALSGAHGMGRCHTDRSGFDGPWTNAPTTFSNLYFTELTENKWRKRDWTGPMQYEDPTKTLMMLPTDMALVSDRKFRKVVSEFAKDEDAFRSAFAESFSRLLELGVPRA